MIEVVPATFDAERASAHVVLVHPEIPQNTGSVARLCAGTGAWLHLVEPLGFRLEDRYLKRAGLDYWPNVRLSVHGSLQAAEGMWPRGRTVLFSRRAREVFWGRRMERGSVLVFGCETVGLPEDLLGRWSGSVVRIPTTGAIRSLNLANAVAIGVYEVLRTTGGVGEENGLTGASG